MTHPLTYCFLLVILQGNHRHPQLSEIDVSYDAKLFKGAAGICVCLLGEDCEVTEGFEKANRMLESIKSVARLTKRARRTSSTKEDGADSGAETEMDTKADYPDRSDRPDEDGNSGNDPIIIA